MTKRKPIQREPMTGEDYAIWGRLIYQPCPVRRATAAAMFMLDGLATAADARVRLTASRFRCQHTLRDNKGG